MILVTGGARFIGANFVLDWLAQSLAKNGCGRYLQRLLKTIEGEPSLSAKDQQAKLLAEAERFA